ncbi:MAG: putative Fe-S cluster assembly protein SufT [Verrucomicrobiae bacterium]|nr:putative Fe-S cluster assembly protein SufT [Verrucomicrobiae bacterium]
MSVSTKVTIQRDVDAVVVPYGDRVVLPKGEEAKILQNLGGNYTVMVKGSLFMIDSKNADALGIEKPVEPPVNPSEKKETNLTPEQVETKVWDALKNCYDPEIPVNIVDLGLIYDCKIERLPECAYQVNIKMTLTAPGCAMGPMIAQDVQNKIIAIEGVEEANVELVWDPPWSQDMMSEAARLQLGLL